MQNNVKNNVCGSDIFDEVILLLVLYGAFAYMSGKEAPFILIAPIT